MDADREVKEYFEGEQEGVKVLYPSFQATFMKGELNLTVRGESATQVVEGLAKAYSEYLKQVIFSGTQSVVKPLTVNVGMKCPVCGSGMHEKIVNKKDGTTAQVFECDNTNCKNSLDFKTGLWTPGKYRTTVWPKK